MKILFCLPVYKIFADRCSVLAEELSKEGHEVCCIIQEGNTDRVGRVDIVQSNWANFEFDEIHRFNPNLIITWNGYFNYFYAATSYLKKRYRVVIMEMGWFRRDRCSYLLDDLAQVSDLSRIPTLRAISLDTSSLDDIRSDYIFKTLDGVTLPEEYIFFPMQLEHDTQIIYTSDVFKTMDSAIGYIKRSIPHVPVVIRNHPLEESFVRPSCVIDMTKSLDSMSLAFYSSIVIGINSTVLAECLLFHKPIIALGSHVAGNAFLSSKDIPWSYKIATSGVSDRYKKGCDFKALTLLKNQWDTTNPPGWIIDNILRMDFSPRL